MIKKFIPLNEEVPSSVSPYEVKTYHGSTEDSKLKKSFLINSFCYGTPVQPCPTKNKSHSNQLNEDKNISHWFNASEKKGFRTSLNKKCQKFKPFTECVTKQRNSQILKQHAIAREKYLKLKAGAKLKVHDAQVSSSDEASVIRADDPDFTGNNIKPRLASPSCSAEVFYVPSRKLLDLKRPRSGIFINETARPTNVSIPYETYNPRQLQKQIESEDRKKYVLFSDGDQLYFPWIRGLENLGEERVDHAEAFRHDCIHFKPVIFPIPDDLDLTFTVSIIFSNESLSGSSSGLWRPIEVACLYVAYIESYLKNADFWTAKVLDNILQSGTKLYNKSVECRFENPNKNFDIIPELIEKEATVDMKLHLTSTLYDEPNILKALTLFFNKFGAGIVSVEHLYILIWKRCANTFYIFDPIGRDAECRRNFECGKASLMIIETLEHVVHLILNLSQVNPTAEYYLYEISLKHFGKIPKPMQLERCKPDKKLYAVVNRFYAVIPALSGIPMILEAKSKDDNPSMMISFLVLIYGQIDPPTEWTVQLLDDLVKFGKKYHSDYISENKLRKLNIVDLPQALLFGNYRVLVEIKPFSSSGHIVDCSSYRASQLTTALINFFSKHDMGLLQLDSSTFGLWKERHVFFVFDTFKRAPSGQVHKSFKGGVGCLQIHLSLSSLCRILYMNAISIKTEGNFFLHGIKIKAVGTFSINKALKDPTSYKVLKIHYPLDTESFDQGDECTEKKTPYEEAQNYNLVQCLSELSVSPCERTCSERDFLQKQKKMAIRNKLSQATSIQSIPENLRIPEFDNYDVIDDVVGEILCDLMAIIQKKTEKRQRKCIEASKILLRSDKEHLEDLKMRLKRGEDYDNICEVLKTTPPINRNLTVKEELALESNFIALPDGSWSVFGISKLNLSQEPLKGILTTLIAAALSYKFNISTWSSDVIEYILETSSLLEQRFVSFTHTLDLIFRNNIPKLQFGSETYHLKINGTKQVESGKLQEALECALMKAQKLLVICKGLSCLILIRFNFIYLFMGCPCNQVGFRSNSEGHMCLLRFLELRTLIRRIIDACGTCGKYVIVELKVENVSEPKPEKFVPYTSSKEELIYDRGVAEKYYQNQRLRDKVKFIKSEIRKESKRIERFQKARINAGEKKRQPLSITVMPESSISDGPDSMEGEDLEQESEKSIEFKHKPGKSIMTIEQDEVPYEQNFGYQLREVDCLFKIQGSTALENRLEASFDKIKTCFFASTIALLYAISRPLDQWESKRIDKVIEVAKNVASKIRDFKFYPERILKNVNVDEFIFKVKVESFMPIGTFGADLEYKIEMASQDYFLIQISNGTFTIYRDKYFHLFDPYSSMETNSDEENEETKCPGHIPKQPEKNTASWVLFEDSSTMLDYIDKRAANKDWRTEYRFYKVSIVSHKMAPQRNQLINVLTDEFDTCRKTSKNDDICANPEEIEWLNIYPNLVIWSRLNRSNAVHKERGSSSTKDDYFDIEIPGKLFSLWGSIHPLSAVFGRSRGKQYLAINVVACLVASIYRVSDWNCQVLDSVVVEGDRYHNESVASISRSDYEISLEDLNTSFKIQHLDFEIHLESVINGFLYQNSKNELNLATALTYFFTNFQYGIIQCMKRCLAIGKSKSEFFMFECQSHGLPLFPVGEGAAYVLRTHRLQVLLYCIVMTLNVSYYNIQFTIHKVETSHESKDQQQQEELEEE